MLTDLTSPSKDTIWQTGLKKEVPTISCLQQTYLIDRNMHQLRMKSWKTYQTNGPENKQEYQYLSQTK
jgi:hypothetical protein